MVHLTVMELVIVTLWTSLVITLNKIYDPKAKRLVQEAIEWCECGWIVRSTVNKEEAAVLASYWRYNKPTGS